MLDSMRNAYNHLEEEMENDRSGTLRMQYGVQVDSRGRLLREYQATYDEHCR